MSTQPQSTDGYANQPEALKKMYLNTEMATVFFVFNDNRNHERIPAHKNVLAACSDAFNTMFYGSLPEYGDITLKEVSVNAFKEFLQFFYLDEIHLTMENIFDVVNLGKKYLFPQCLTTCERFLMDSLRIENVCLIYGWAIFFDLIDLHRKCVEMITVHTEAVFQSSGFLECDRSILAQILKLERLSCAETVVFHSCMAWVKAASNVERVSRQNIDQQLGDLFYEIRFGAITLEEINGLSLTCDDLFSVNEYKEIFQMNASKDFQSTIFKRQLRQMHYQWNKNSVISCSRVIDHHNPSWYNFQDIETTTFSSNKPILLGEIVYGGVTGYYPNELAIFESSIDNQILKMIHFQKITLTSDHTQTLTLDKAILVKPNYNYEIQFKQCRVNSQFCNAPLRMETRLPNTDIIIKFPNDFQRQASFIVALNFNRIF